MRTVPIKDLCLKSFQPYGTFAQMINPSTIHIGAEPIEFFRDMALLDLGGAGIGSFSVCRVLWRELVIDTIEYHDGCGEGILPLDSDILLHVAPATPTGDVPYDRIEVFRVPKGTFVSLRPGVWHHAPYAFGSTCANTLIVLPERTYAKDCKVVSLAPEQQLRIEGA